jgi:hypothetical protein
MSMDEYMCFARTEKGREELLGSNRALKSRPRQVLFLVGNSISVADLKEKLPTCLELENILEQLWEDGYIGQVKTHKSMAQPETDIPAGPPLEAARLHALRVLASLIGEQSPVYIQVKNANDVNALLQAVGHGKKLLAAVASSAQASAYEQRVLTILKPAMTVAPPQINGIESAKLRALEIVTSLVGTRSPVYAKVNSCRNRADLIEAVNTGKKVIAAVASASHAHSFETEVLSLLEQH